MSWPMPTGQWNPGNMGVPPNMAPALNMGSYNNDQWSSMQQQNWQHWAQWQQQYAQWQSQYGDKYAAQMQTMGAIPPLPMNTAVPPPAPPPPDKPPPPPPPHENNQPLYAAPPSDEPQPIQPKVQQQNINPGNFNYNSNTAGNKQNWSYPSETSQSSQGVNSEALKKLAEEEKLFDIQFQKWEEEIEKWRRENINHPDKEAYKEYESKFEACRAQLLERRQQMKQKRDRLLGSSQQSVPTPVPAPTPNVVPIKQATQNFGQYRQPQNYDNSAQNNFSQPPPDHHQYSQSNYNRSNNKNIDPQDRYEYYDSVEVASTGRSSFLPASNSTKGIPGLDLVPENEKKKNSQQEIIDITDQQEQAQHNPPDYSKISKGINNILGDEKIMNILSMVRSKIPEIKGKQDHMHQPNHQQQGGQFQQNVGGQQQYNQGHNQLGGQHQQHHSGQPKNNYSNQYNNSNTNQHDAPQNQGDGNYNDQHYGNRQNYNNRQGPNFNNQAGQGPYNQQKRNNYGQGQDMDCDNYYDRKTNSGNQNMGNSGQGPLMRQNTAPRPLMETQLPLLERSNDYHGGAQGNQRMHMINEPPLNLPPKQKWVDEPLFTPSIIVEYEHKPLRLKARDFIEPVHMFDYNHISKDDENKKKSFDMEAEEFNRLHKKEFRDYDESRFGERSDRYVRDSYARDTHSRDTYERRVPREVMRDEYPPRVPPFRDGYDERRRDDRYDERRRDDRDRLRGRDDHRDRSRNDGERGNMESDRGRTESDRGRTESDRDPYRPRDKENRREESRRRSRSRERERGREQEYRKRGHSKESEASETSKKFKDDNKSNNSDKPHVVMIDDILESPGRDMRPEKIVIILRGPPGSGKSYLAKLIRDREAEYGGTARIMSIDDYFMQEGEVEEKDLSTGKTVKKQTLKYEYDEKFEESYLNSLKRAFKRTITDGFFSFLIYDAVNDHLKSYADVWNFARQSGFQVYICTMDVDSQACFKRNIHNRTLQDIEIICTRFFPTPKHHIQLDPTTLLQSAAITDVQMEDATDEVVMEDVQETEVESSFTSKWEKMDDATQLARLDGISKPLRPSQLSMEDYLQLDEWQPNKAKPGKKTVRWADIEERREQEKMRAIGFVVGQTDWDRMTDPTMGSSALTQTKYIERVNKRL